MFLQITCHVRLGYQSVICVICVCAQALRRTPRSTADAQHVGRGEHSSYAEASVPGFVFSSYYNALCQFHHHLVLIVHMSFIFVLFSSSSSSSSSSSLTSLVHHFRLVVLYCTTLHTLPRWKYTMEDAFCAHPETHYPSNVQDGEGEPEDKHTCDVYAVFDGHGGSEVAKFCAEQLLSFLLKCPTFRQPGTRLV